MIVLPKVFMILCFTAYCSSQIKQLNLNVVFQYNLSIKEGNKTQNISLFLVKGTVMQSLY